MAVEVNYFQINGDEYFVPISVRMPGSELAKAVSSGASSVEIDLIAEIKDEHGVTYRNVRDLVRIPINRRAAATTPTMIQYETGFTMLPGSYIVKVLARNGSTGRLGTFEAPFTVPNLEREMTRVRVSSVVLTNQRVDTGDALSTVTQSIAAGAANPLVEDGRKLVPAVGHVVAASQPLYVLLEAYERDTASVRPLLAYLTFYRDAAIAFETKLLLEDTWNEKTRAVPIRFTVPPDTLSPGTYDCQVTVLDPTAGRAAFWRGGLRVH
jgi:hypothetical protein